MITNHLISKTDKTYFIQTLRLLFVMSIAKKRQNRINQFAALVTATHDAMMLWSMSMTLSISHLQYQTKQGKTPQNDCHFEANFRIII